MYKIELMLKLFKLFSCKLKFTSYFHENMKNVSNVVSLEKKCKILMFVLNCYSCNWKLVLHVNFDILEFSRHLV